jgi:hypothetical protein
VFEKKVELKAGKRRLETAGPPVESTRGGECKATMRHGLVDVKVYVTVLLKPQHISRNFSRTLTEWQSCVTISGGLMECAGMNSMYCRM